MSVGIVAAFEAWSNIRMRSTLAAVAPSHPVAGRPPAAIRAVELLGGEPRQATLQRVGAAAGELEVRASLDVKSDVRSSASIFAPAAKSPL